MKQENNELDDFLQQKVDEAQFEFKESYWDKMESLLDEDQKPKKRFLFWRGLSVLLGVALMSTIAFLWSKSSHKSTEHAQVAAVAENTKSESVAPTQNLSIDSNVNSGLKNQSNEIGIQTNESKVSSNVSELEKKHNKTRSNAKFRSSRKLNEVKNEDGLANAPRVTEAKGNPSSKSFPDFQDKDIHKNDEEILTNSSSTISKKDKTIRDNHVEKQGRKKKLNQSRNAESESTVKDGPDKEALKNSTTKWNQQPMRVIDTTVFYAKAPRDETQFNPRYIAGLENYIPERLEKVTVITYEIEKSQVPVVKSESKMPIEEKGDSSMSPDVKRSIIGFAMAGANFNKGFTGNSVTRLPWGVSPFLSIGIEKPISQKISIAAQVGFTYFNGLNITQKAKQYTYSFGLDSSEYFSVNYTRIWQMYVPISLQYHLGNKHRLMLGVAGSYAMDTHSWVEDNQKNTSYSSNGYRDGFRTFDLLAQIGYDYKFNSKLSAMLFWQQGFSDVTKDNVLNHTQRNMQSKLSLGIKYNFKRNGK